jgi:lipopolysaccharide/colanic/teichoic acid biosynthesis glycosyltransferase
VIKRTFDFILATIGIVVSFPIWLILGFLIWLEDGGSIFFVQGRPGLNAHFFKCIKFRSMSLVKNNDSGLLLKQRESPGVTVIGRFMRKLALDELPQLINIAKGDMSFVGPRAVYLEDEQSHNERLKSILELAEFKERSKVHPGLTGAAQILINKDSDPIIKYKYDIWYISHQSFGLDLYLICLSFLVAFAGKWESRFDKFPVLTRKLKEGIERDIRV